MKVWLWFIFLGSTPKPMPVLERKNKLNSLLTNISSTKLLTRFWLGDIYNWGTHKPEIKNHLTWQIRLLALYNIDHYNKPHVTLLNFLFQKLPDADIATAMASFSPQVHKQRLLHKHRLQKRLCQMHGARNTQLDHKYLFGLLDRTVCLCNSLQFHRTLAYILSASKPAEVIEAWSHPFGGLQVFCHSVHSMDNLTNWLANSVRKELRFGRDSLVCCQCIANKVICSLPC